MFLPAPCRALTSNVARIGFATLVSFSTEPREVLPAASERRTCPSRRDPQHNLRRLVDRKRSSGCCAKHRGHEPFAELTGGAFPVIAVPIELPLANVDRPGSKEALRKIPPAVPRRKGLPWNVWPWLVVRLGRSDIRRNWHSPSSEKWNLCQCQLADTILRSNS